MKAERERAARPRKRAPAKGELVFEGLGVSPGIAVGPAHVVEGGSVHVPEYRIEPDQIEAERARFSAAVAKAQKQLVKLKGKSANLPGTAAEEIGFLLDAHLQMLTGSRVVRGVEKLIEEGLNAEAAVQAEISKVAQDFAALDDAYMAARAQDIREVGDRLIRNLTQTPYEAFSHLSPGSIIVGEELTPADTALMNPELVGGLAAVLGGAESHTAIMARSLGLPAVLGVAGLIGNVRSGDVIAIDGDGGRIYLNPSAKTLAQLKTRQAEDEREEKQLSRLKKLPAITRDGIAIGLQANLELPRELDMAMDAGAEGVGLLRTEFLYMNRDDLPDEDEQYKIYVELIEGLSGRPITARTLDVGADKLAYSLAAHLGGGINPALGLRAIRLSLRERSLLEAQLAAMIRAGAHGPLRILLPMISTLIEIRQVREVLDRVVRRLHRRRVKVPDPLPPIGVMIEVPGAALSADAFAQIVDFFAIGTNDLTMYTLAIDRGEEQVAHLYNPLHPAVLRLIQFATEAALRARIPVSVCGEIAGDPRYTPLLLGLGIRELSMAATALPRVKQRIRDLDLVAATRCASTIMDQSDPGRIAALLDDFNTLA
ncbi:phosphoenolpyruvate-protein phosphotransferase [Hypericibacter adhaerens]|jgi:phosphotransferase system enzyme I (PtsI)|uniref:Phosphoenolpyruvate-protein phosphotransferase n=1 Tax=Hypericibacter adhaerens TaxID=2602016 RepID=A0A5J6MRE2_9PROT|nr:phosphoenolpyruvate--protein phosphotransferase [Hypericibacter adhaerens]QEX20252.1 phosphoenolpyruvate-protein phosphotransferase [Hypericibacter adhaerens]